MGHERTFLLRHPVGFDTEALKIVSSGYHEWCDEVKAAVETWATTGVPGTEPPEYVFHAPEVSEDRKVVSINIEGDPHSYGALKMFEDGVPPQLYWNLPPVLLKDIELSLVHEEMGLHAGEWYRAPLR